MSTRGQILFRCGKQKIMIYRHSDSYPRGALGDLVEFLQWNIGRNLQFDYMVATYIYYMKKDSEQYCDYFETNKMEVNNRYATNWKDRKYAENTNLQTKLGYGIQSDTRISSWVEYFYDVEVIDNSPERSFEDKGKIIIKAYEVNIGSQDMTLTKFLKGANLIQTVTLDQSGNILSNDIKDKEYQDVFKGEPVPDASGLKIFMGDLDKFKPSDIFNTS